jgi:hypothetical protein
VDATTDFDDADSGVQVLIYDVGTIANSELATIVGWNDGVSYVVSGTIANTFDASDVIYSGVDHVRFTIPPGADAYRVVFFNTHSTANYAVRIDAVMATDLQ